MRSRGLFAATVAAIALTGCSGHGFGTGGDKAGVKPEFSFPVTSNETPYSQCLEQLRGLPGNHLPVFAVGEVADKTGQIDYTKDGHALTQGVTEMVISALYKTGKAQAVERFDLRIPLAQMKMAEQHLTTEPIGSFQIRSSDFVILGALTELNYNIMSQGAGLWVSGIGGGGRTVVVNVALDLRVVDSRTFQIRYVTSLQKQIYGFEVEANVFRFFGTQLVELNAGRVKNEPLQLGVRSVVEMAVYRIMTDFLGLPASRECQLVETDHMGSQLKDLAPVPVAKPE